MRRLIVGTGWKMNLGMAETTRYVEYLLRDLDAAPIPASLEIFVLPPFTSLAAAVAGLAGREIHVGGQNMHWDRAGAWTGEISASMLAEAGCRYVELAHSERLAHFGETYALVRRKLDAALEHGLTPILCLGETAAEKAAGAADDVLRDQLTTALAGQSAARMPEVIFAYEPRWAIGTADAASPDYVAVRHAAIRAILRDLHGVQAASQARIIYGGSVNLRNGAALIALPDVDGLFAGRLAWSPEGFTSLIRLVAEAAHRKECIA